MGVVTVAWMRWATCEVVTPSAGVVVDAGRGRNVVGPRSTSRVDGGVFEVREREGIKYGFTRVQVKCQDHSTAGPPIRHDPFSFFLAAAVLPFRVCRSLLWFTVSCLPQPVCRRFTPPMDG